MDSTTRNSVPLSRRLFEARVVANVSGFSVVVDGACGPVPLFQCDLENDAHTLRRAVEDLAGALNLRNAGILSFVPDPRRL